MRRYLLIDAHEWIDEDPIIPCIFQRKRIHGDGLGRISGEIDSVDLDSCTTL